MRTSWKLRRLNEADVPAASDLLAEINHGPTKGELQASLRDSIARWPTLQLGAFEPRTGELLGLVTGALDERERGLGWSHDIVVQRSMRSSGLGGALIEAQLDAFRTAGCKRVRGQSPAALYRAIPFFERHGFRIVERFIARGFFGIADGQELAITERVL